METGITFRDRVLNGFLRVMVVALIGILVAVVVATLLAAVGII